MNNKNIVTKSGNVTYYVNREKKTVAAVIRCDVATPLYIFDRVFDKFENANGNKNLMDINFDNHNIRNAFISERYVGVAKCHDDDIFNEEFGKKLALARAKTKKAEAVCENFLKFLELLDKLDYLVCKKAYELSRRWGDSHKEVDDLLQSISKTENADEETVF